jgi:hypothetical protein
MSSMKSDLKGRIGRALGARTRITRAIVAVASAAMLATSCDVHGVSEPGTLSTLTVSPDPKTLMATSTQQFTAVGADFSGAPVAVTPTWTVVAGGGTITSGGMFTAGTTPGTFASTVKATSGKLSTTATVVVTVGPLASLAITPSPASMVIGAAQQFTAVGRDASGNVVAITPSWAIVAGGGSIDPTSGLFTAGSTSGLYINTVRVSVGALAAVASVTVTTGPLAAITVTPNPTSVQAGNTQRFTAVGRDAGGNVVSIVPTWSIANGGGTINAATGDFTAGAASGTFANTIRATSGGISGSATVTVTPIPLVLASMAVTPNPASVQAGRTQQFSATGRDGNGNPFGISPTWSVVNGGGTIDPNTGDFTAGSSTGTYVNTIRATSGGISAFATVTVTPIPPVLASITVTPNPASIPVNGTQQFSAIGRDANGNPIAISPTWSVVNGGGTIDSSTGSFRAGNSSGTFVNTVRATSGTVSGTATVTVQAIASAPVLSLGAAAPNGIMAGTEVTCVAGGTINADVSISPGNTLNGFGPCVITGVQHLGDASAAQAQIALTAAYNTLAGMPCPGANAIVANLGGTTKAAGVYCSASGIGVTGTLTLDGGGNPNAMFVFQAGSGLTTAGNIVLINGAQARNVYWQVGTSATIGTASQWKGNILAYTSITLVDNAQLIGRALARHGAVTLGTNNTITLP